MKTFDAGCFSVRKSKEMVFVGEQVGVAAMRLSYNMEAEAKRTVLHGKSRARGLRRQRRGEHGVRGHCATVRCSK